METTIIGCKTIREELTEAMIELSCPYPVLWLESGLHNTPGILTDTIQSLLDEVCASRVLMAMGYCGNAVCGLRTGNYELIIPRADDCITMLLGSTEKRKVVNAEKPTYFLTKGWLDGERNIWVEYQYAVKKYGEKQAREIIRLMFHQYRRLGILCTGCYDMDKILPETHKIAETFDLEHAVIPASNRYLTELILGPWPGERFLKIPPNSTIKQSDLFC